MKLIVEILGKTRPKDVDRIGTQIKICRFVSYFDILNIFEW